VAKRNVNQKSKKEGSMGKDKVAHPVNVSRPGGVKQVKSAKIEGPTATAENKTAFNRSK